MPDEQTDQTLNEETPASGAEETLNAGDSSTPMETEDGLLSTTEFVDGVEESEKTPEDNTDGDSDGDTGEGDEKGPIPYTRFQEKVKQTQELTEKVTSFEEQLAERDKKIAELEGRINEGEKPKESKGDGLNFKPMHVMSDDQLRDWGNDSPLEFYSNLAAQIMHETSNFIFGEMDKRNQQSTYQDKLAEFGEKNDGFDQLLNSGKIEDFVRKNPGHDVFSAYYEMTADKRQQSNQEAIDKAVAEALKKQKAEFEKNTKAKRELRTISGGSAQVPSDGDVELKDTSVHGGLTATLAQRLAARRKKAG